MVKRRVEAPRDTSPGGGCQEPSSGSSVGGISSGRQAGFACLGTIPKAKRLPASSKQLEMGNSHL